MLSKGRILNSNIRPFARQEMVSSTPKEACLFNKRS